MYSTRTICFARKAIQALLPDGRNTVTIMVTITMSNTISIKNHDDDHDHVIDHSDIRYAATDNELVLGLGTWQAAKVASVSSDRRRGS